jgi:hypothetical protein
VDAKERFLHPGALTSLRQLNPAISPRCERSIFQALSMHPNERPSNARELRAILMGSQQPAPMPTTSYALGAPSEPEFSWGYLFRRHLVLVTIAFVLLAAAALISLY